MQTFQVGDTVTVEHSSFLPHFNGACGTVVFSDFDIEEWQYWYLIQFIDGRKCWFSALELLQPQFK